MITIEILKLMLPISDREVEVPRILEGWKDKPDATLTIEEGSPALWFDR